MIITCHVLTLFHTYHIHKLHSADDWEQNMLEDEDFEDNQVSSCLYKIDGKV